MSYKRLSKDKKWYEEVSFGVRKLVKIGSSYGFIIPKYFFDNEKIDYNEEMLLIGLKRRRGVADELSKAEVEQFERFRKMKKKEQEILMKSLDDLKV